MTAEVPPAGELEQRILGAPLRYTRAEISASAAVPVERARRYWRALGFADVGDDVVAFTDADLAALRKMLAMVDEGVIDEDFALNLTRSMGHTMARLADWQVEALVEHLRDLGSRGSANAAASVELAERLLPEMEGLLLFAWRRQLAAVSGRALVAVEQEGTRYWMSVGFADLVSYTRMAQQMDERELARLVSRFEAHCADVVAAEGGRVVKTVGDEVLFAADQVDRAAEIALLLAESMAADPQLPDVRVGVATGTVVSRLGDVFGRTVNLASRLTASAQPATVLVDRATAAGLTGHPAYQVELEQVRAVRGWGLVEPGLLRRRDARVP